MKKVLVVAVLVLTIKWSIGRAAVVEGKKEIIHNTLKFKIYSIRFLKTILVDIILKSQYKTI